MNLVSITLPIRTVSEANARECWQAKYKRAKAQRLAVKYALISHKKALRSHDLPITCTLTRVGVRKLDGDNLQRSFKAIRDQVAEEIGIDDGSDKIEWRYAQEKGRLKEYAVQIDIGIREAEDA